MANSQPRIRNILSTASLAIGILLSPVAAADGADPAHAPALDTSRCAPDGVALGGYDLVAYRQPDAPRLGSADLSAEHDGLTYRFATQANLDAFRAEPDAYLPSYRGWCSATLAMGRLACPDYTNFKLEDGRLLLFERIGFTNGRDVWDSDPLTHRQSADQHFRTLLGL